MSQYCYIWRWLLRKSISYTILLFHVIHVQMVILFVHVHEFANVLSSHRFKLKATVDINLHASWLRDTQACREYFSTKKVFFSESFFLKCSKCMKYLFSVHKNLQERQYHTCSKLVHITKIFTSVLITWFKPIGSNNTSNTACQLPKTPLGIAEARHSKMRA